MVVIKTLRYSMVFTSYIYFILTEIPFASFLKRIPILYIQLFFIYINFIISCS
jgi:hypothetical protein